MSDSLSLGDLGYPTADTVRRALAVWLLILPALIAELRHRHAPYRVCMECDDWYAGCEDHEHITVCLWCCTSHGYHSRDCADNHTGTTLAEHCVTVGMADRAEARMKGLFDE